MFSIPVPDDIAQLIHDACTRSPQATSALTARLLGSRLDRSTPIERDWLRRWSPVGMQASAPDCGCAAGRCGWCN